tara:strand:+ start:2962 stop:3804 length:843 start_codon:yes stop_codon:yes gene_type:complete
MTENNEEPTQQPQSAGEETAASDIPTSGAADFSSQFAALSRKERDLHLRQKELAAQEQRMGDMAKKLEDYEKTMSLAKENPEAFLERSGLSMKELLTRELNGGDLPENEVLKKQLADQAKQIEDLRQSQVEKDKQAEQQRLHQLRTDYVDQIKTTIDNVEGDKFELVKAANAYETVYAVLQESYNETGKDIGMEAAAGIVEDYYRKELERYKDTAVLKKLSGGSTEPVQNELATSPAESEQKPRTTRTLENTPVATPAEPERPLTRDERLARFAEHIRWV